MRYATILSLVVFIPGIVFSQLTESMIDDKVQALLGKMTLEEKVGQMTQIAINVVSKQEGTANAHWILDAEKLDEAINRYHVGSIFSVWNKALDVETWRNLITEIQDRATATRMKIPVLYGVDAIHGANFTMGATIFPHSLNMAATWNRNLVRRSAEITALEARASGIPWNFNPVLGVGRNPVWPRLWETFGEDPYAVTVFGQAYIEGLQGDNPADPVRVAGTAKHFLGYSVPLSGRDRTPAWIPERMLREIFLPPFKAAVDAGVLTMMLNSSEINGIPIHSSPYYVTDMLRGELGFKGLIVTDWNDINNLYTREMVAHSQKDAVRMAVMAGVDMSMVPLDYSFYTHLIALVKEGAVPKGRIDEAAGRILRVKFKLGLFDDPFPAAEPLRAFADPASRATALQAARESIILLRNEKRRLPLSKRGKVLVTGPAAHSRSALSGGWTYTWQGNVEALYPTDRQTILEAIREKIGPERVTYVPGAGFDATLDIASAVEAAKAAQVTVLCLGEPPYTEFMGNISDLTLPKAQLELAQALAATGTPLVVVLVQGRPRIIETIHDMTDAIVMAGLPGLEGGQAIADVIFGDYNPGGKLPITYPRHPNDFLTYDHKASASSQNNRYNPQYAFGHGLSYTSFEYKKPRLNRKRLRKNQTLQVKVTVTNRGTMAGKEPVLLYVRDLVRSVTPSLRQLKGFDSISLKPGQSKTVEFVLSPADLSFIGRDGSRITESGDFKIEVGGLSATFSLD